MNSAPSVNVRFFYAVCVRAGWAVFAARVIKPIRFFRTSKAVALSVLLLCIVLDAAVSTLAAQGGTSASPSPQPRVELPQFGYCPIAVTDPDCPTKLEAYVQAYKNFSRAVETYRRTLDRAMAAENWTADVGGQTKSIATGLDQLSKRIDLKTAVGNLAASKFTSTLSELDGKKKDYQDALTKWRANPLEINRALVDAAADTYYGKLREAFGLADGYAAFKDSFAPIKADLEAAAAETERLRVLLNSPDSLQRYAKQLRAIAQEADPPLDAAYTTAKTAAEDALRAGAKLEKAPIQPDSAKRLVTILDALFGELHVLKAIKAKWEEDKTATNLKQIGKTLMSGKSHRRVAGDVCDAADYVKTRCEFDEVSAKVCLHNDAIAKPEYSSAVNFCDDKDFKRGEGIRHQLIVHKRSECSFSVRPSQICGGTIIGASASRRFALILFRCGSDLPEVKVAANNQRVSLFCN